MYMYMYNVYDIYNVYTCTCMYGYVYNIHVDNIQCTCVCVNAQNFFRHFGPMENAPYGIHPDVMDTYVKSCGKL